MSAFSDAADAIARAAKAIPAGAKDAAKSAQGPSTTTILIVGFILYRVLKGGRR